MTFLRVRRGFGGRIRVGVDRSTTERLSTSLLVFEFFCPAARREREKHPNKTIHDFAFGIRAAYVHDVLVFWILFPPGSKLFQKSQASSVVPASHRRHWFKSPRTTETHVSHAVHILPLPTCLSCRPRFSRRRSHYTNRLWPDASTQASQRSCLVRFLRTAWPPSRVVSGGEPCTWTVENR